ncbi:hypothetical protein FA13DRAFT_31836 [Coprinellus micaceus]|uniref:Uncharacterized protein n=1 Tax=Coprinellus micaceus TaxID=71717 RepID=A0A4Y7U0R2_COPMI|nr:hypothetical protein FA13DRAFT_31836 [Coprinellus micaceus]
MTCHFRTALHWLAFATLEIIAASIVILREAVGTKQARRTLEFSERPSRVALCTIPLEINPRARLVLSPNGHLPLISIGPRSFLMATSPQYTGSRGYFTVHHHCGSSGGIWLLSALSRGSSANTLPPTLNITVWTLARVFEARSTDRLKRRLVMGCLVLCLARR